MSDTINSVLGFNLNVEIRDQNGELIKTGARTTCFGKPAEILPKVHILNKKFFTNFNEPLLAKIREYKRINE